MFSTSKFFHNNTVTPTTYVDNVFSAYTYAGMGTTGANRINNGFNIAKVGDAFYANTTLLMGFDYDIVNDKTGIIDLPVVTGSTVFSGAGVFTSACMNGAGINAATNCVIKTTTNSLGANFHNPFCIEAWVRCSTGATAGGNVYVSLIEYTDSANTVNFDVQSADGATASVIFSVTGTNPTTLSYTTTGLTTLQLIRISYDGTTLRIYQNAALQTSAAWSGFTNGTFTSNACRFQAIGGGVTGTAAQLQFDELRWTFGVDRAADATTLPTNLFPRTSTATAALATDAMVWIKNRTSAVDNVLQDNVRGFTNALGSNLLTGSTVINGTFPRSYGFEFIGSTATLNAQSNNYVSWTFLKQVKFFDIVTYTGNGANRTIAHSLGSVPGMIMVFRTDITSATARMVYHANIPNTQYLSLNTSGAAVTDATVWNSTSATSSVFSVGTHTDVNASAGTYVAYIFANDTTSTSLIKTSSFTTDASGNATVSLGWEPQFGIIKGTGAANNWIMLDETRGWSPTASSTLSLLANTNATETAVSLSSPNASGFSVTGLAVSSTYVYTMVRRPNKPPTAGTQIYNAISRVGTSSIFAYTTLGFAPDLVAIKSTSATSSHYWFDRLRAATQYLSSNLTNVQATDAVSLTSFDMSGFTVGNSSGTAPVNSSGLTYINYGFKRAPGVLDMVYYNTTGVNKTEAHNLSVQPELWMVKCVSAPRGWFIGSTLLAATEYLQLETTAAKITDATAWNSTYPTASVVSLGTLTGINEGGATKTQIMYLFATVSGITKVGSYTGNGTSINIDCGFAAGARYILIKRTDSTGDWYVWDTVRGIIAGNDPHISLNTTAAQVTTDDSIGPYTPGFTANQLAATNINVTSATYIFLAIA
jgi:hypothetical protein